MGCILLPVVSIREFDRNVDSIWLHGLWQRTMNRRWALSCEAMLRTLVNIPLLLVAECEGLRSGFCAVDWRQGKVAALILLLVEPARQRCGIGTGLLRKAEAILKVGGVRRLNLGAGEGDYFWPGLPQEQTAAWSFFTSHGFSEEESSEDLIQALDNFQIPAWVAARQLTTGTTLHLSERSDTSAILAFERRYFPAWASYFEGETKQGRYGNILFVQGADRRILGTVLVKEHAPVLWQATRETQVGTLNTLGVVPEKQGQGIGMTLTAGAMEHLRDCGCSSCFIQWTGLADWYGKLGAHLWAHYCMASKSL